MIPISHFDLDDLLDEFEGHSHRSKVGWPSTLTDSRSGIFIIFFKLKRVISCFVFCQYSPDDNSAGK